MKDVFEMTDLGNLSHFLGLESKQTEHGIFMHQRKYALGLIKRFSMTECNLVSTPVEVGIKLELQST